MWTETIQRQYGAIRLRYASGVSDEEWALIAAELPAPKTLGRPRTIELRAWSPRWA